MRVVVILLALISFSNGIQYDGIRAKYGNGTTGAEADKEYFFTVPRNIQEAKAAGYSLIERPAGPIPKLVMYCPPGRILCPLFNSTGFVAGLQVAVPIQSIPGELKPELYFDKWNATAWNGEPAQEFWTATQYYVTERTGSTVVNGSTLQEDGVWVKGLDGKLMKIPTSETELRATTFKIQNCVPNMGMHYYYNMTPQLGCDKPMLPWFPLVTEGKLLGVGFQTFGAKPILDKNTTQIDWFENIPREPRTTPLRAIPHAPECFLDNSVKYGRLSIHIYYINKPWELRCESKESIEPTSAADPSPDTETVSKLALDSKNGSGIAYQIGDRIQKLVAVVLNLVLLVVFF